MPAKLLTDMVECSNRVLLRDRFFFGRKVSDTFVSLGVYMGGDFADAVDMDIFLIGDGNYFYRRCGQIELSREIIL